MHLAWSSITPDELHAMRLGMAGCVPLGADPWQLPVAAGAWREH